MFFGVLSVLRFLVVYLEGWFMYFFQIDTNLFQALRTCIQDSLHDKNITDLIWIFWLSIHFSSRRHDNSDFFISSLRALSRLSDWVLSLASRSTLTQPFTSTPEPEIYGRGGWGMGNFAFTAKWCSLGNWGYNWNWGRYSYFLGRIPLQTL